MSDKEKEMEKMNEEIEDDLICDTLYKAYLADTSDDKHDTISLEDFAKEMGVELYQIDHDVLVITVIDAGNRGQIYQRY